VWRGAAAAAAPPPAPAPAPAPEPPPPPWAGSFGAGLALTSGNADTFNLNFSFDLTSNPKARNVFKAEALYLRGEQEGDLTVNRFALKVRDEHALNPRTFLFGQLDYLRDTFKSIDYLLAPTVGAGYKVIETPAASLVLDAGLGLKFEKSPLADLETAGAATAGEKFAYKFSESASLTQSVAALWTLDDFGDALYTFKIGVTSALTARSQVKVELVDLYKTRPPDALTEKNDVSLITALVYKF
jgi:putative salt-induced outer membrane protein